MEQQNTYTTYEQPLEHGWAPEVVIEPVPDIMEYLGGRHDHYDRQPENREPINYGDVTVY